MLGGSDRRELAHYFTVAQVGVEMAVPPGIGAFADSYFGSGPWGAIVGAVLGLTVGLFHLVQIVNREERLAAERRRDKTPPAAGPDKESRLP
jgi:F0F1-type ATP synthase assembly protein I